MTRCHLSEDMMETIKHKLIEVRDKATEIITAMDQGGGCLLCKITGIKDLATEAEVLASIYHFRTSLLPNVEGMDEVTKSLATLADRRHGALIAFEQEDSLAPYIEACNTTGVALEAKVSAQLLQALFYPGNPLHDGAVIISHGIIKSAGCVFPLSDMKYTEKGKKIGTRHRAALGLSERTDALVIVVSEETGQVSLAINGVLHPVAVNLCDNIKKEPSV